jgi:hypothetical protein
MRHVLAGVELADSLVVNPHKWLFTPIDLSAMFTRRPEVLKRAFSLVPEYLVTREQSDVVNLMDYGVQLGRRFRALKLWMVIRAFGAEGLAARLRQQMEMAREFAGWVDAAPGWERVAPVPFSLVCFRYAPAGTSEAERETLNAAILERVNASGTAYLSHTKLNGRYVLRLAIGNMRTEPRHVRSVAAQGSRRHGGSGLTRCRSRKRSQPPGPRTELAALHVMSARSSVVVVDRWSIRHLFTWCGRGGPAADPGLLMAVAAITAPVAKILAEVTLVLTAVADVLAALLPSVVVPDLARVLPQLTTILPDLMRVAAKLAGVAMNVPPVRAKVVRFARRHSRVTGNVWMFDSLCAHEGRTSNEQGRSNGSHSEIAHSIPQRQNPALASMACAARTTVALWRTLRADLAALRSGKFSVRLASCERGVQRSEPDLRDRL